MYEFVKIIDATKKSELKLIKKKDLMNLKLYHVSDNPHIKTLSPRIPKSEDINKGLENGTIKRVCFAPSIEQCLQAICAEKGKEYIVYVPKRNLMYSQIYKCNTQDAPGAYITDEYWCLTPIEVEPLYKVKVGNTVETNSGKYEDLLNYKVLESYKVTPSNVLEDLAYLNEVKYVSAGQTDLEYWLEFKDYKEARKFATMCSRVLNEGLIERADNKVYYVKL